MRNTGILALAFFAMLLLLGCGASPSSTPVSDSKISNAKEKIGEAIDATAEAAKEKRDASVRDFQKGLDVLDAKLKALEARAGESEGDAKKELNEKLLVAKSKREVAAKKLHELREASHDRWKKVEEGVSGAFDDLKKMFD